MARPLHASEIATPNAPPAAPRARRPARPAAHRPPREPGRAACPSGRAYPREPGARASGARWRSRQAGWRGCCLRSSRRAPPSEAAALAARLGRAMVVSRMRAPLVAVCGWSRLAGHPNSLGLDDEVGWQRSHFELLARQSLDVAQKAALV